MNYKLLKDKERLLTLLQKAKIPTPIIEAIDKVPRELFVPKPLHQYAYQNTALPIGWGQTISQPLTVARMTALLQPEKGQKVLEIGTGSGYQAAILATLGMKVYTVERVEMLYRAVRKIFHSLNLHIVTALRDGTFGWPQYAPYDRIIITAAVETPPFHLLEQLNYPSGLCVFPLKKGNRQFLARMQYGFGKQKEPKLEFFDECEFVPLISQNMKDAAPKK